MNKRFVSVVVFALVVSGLASLVIYRLLVTRLSSNAKTGNVKVVVAAHNLAIGTLIRDTDVRLIDWNGSLPPQAVRAQEQVVGRGIVAAVYEGEPVLESRLAPKGAGAGMAALIPKGMRAVAVRVNEVVGLAGFVVPGMHVDVLLHGVPPGESRQGGSETRTILQSIEVLSAGQNIQKDAEGKPISVQVVNLLVTPEQAETLSLASTDAKIQLVLRNPLDQEQATPPGTALAKLFGQVREAPKPVAPRPQARPVAKPAPKAAPQAAPPPVLVQIKVVEVLHGGKKTEAKFENSAEVHP